MAVSFTSLTWITDRMGNIFLSRISYGWVNKRGVTLPTTTRMYVIFFSVVKAREIEMSIKDVGLCLINFSSISFVYLFLSFCMLFNSFSSFPLFHLYNIYVIPPIYIFKLMSTVSITSIHSVKLSGKLISISYLIPLFIRYLSSPLL